jgi:formate hydrogenlyase subunit 4
LIKGIIQKLKAKLQNRNGAPVTQPYYDLIKTFKKREVISEDASWIFRYSPYIIFTVSVIIPLGIPILFALNYFPYLSDFLVVIYMIGLMTFFLALSGIDVGSAFGGFGSSREMTLSAVTEGAFVFSLLAPALLAKTNNLNQMVEVLKFLPISQLFPLIFAFIAFLAVLLSETKRYPFDNPSTHLELTMIHEAMILEYSGKRLALLEWASYNKLLFFIILGLNIFFPWTIATTVTFNTLIISLAGLILKVMGVVAIITFIESFIAKYRYFRLPDVLLTAFVLSIISVIIVSI